MKICITGITGYVGSQVVRALHMTGHELICLVRKKELVPDEIKDKHTVLRVDLTKDIPEIECDLLIHCAALVSDKILSFFMNKTNVEGTRKLMQSISEHSKVIFISCASVYNITQETHVEDEQINSGLLTPYGRSKLRAEQLLQNEFNKRDITILRVHHLYGMRSRSFLTNVIKVYSNGVLKVPGDLNKKISLTSIDLLLNVIQKFVEYNFKGIEIYNVVDSKEYNLKDVSISLLSSALKREVKLKEKSEYYLRVIAGLRTVLVPGNNITQNSIDLWSRDHYLKSEKLNHLFSDLPETDFYNHLEEYSAWITNNGISNVLKASSRIYWL